MSLSYYTQDPKELFDLLLDLREFSNLWLQVRIKTRLGEEAKAEKQRLDELIEKLADKLEILPFRGRLLKHLLTRRPTILPKWTGIPDTVDKILSVIIEYLTYRCDYAVWEDIRLRPEKIKEYIDRNAHRKDKANGHIFEIVVRKWLKEFMDPYWRNVQRLQLPALPGMSLHGIEMDAVSMIKEDEKIKLSTAEIKWTLDQNFAIMGKPPDKKPIVQEYAENISILLLHLNKFTKVTNIQIKEVALIGGNKLQPIEKNDISQRLRERISKELSKRDLKYTPEKVKTYDITDIQETVKDSQNPLKEVVSFLARM